MTSRSGVKRYTPYLNLDYDSASGGGTWVAEMRDKEDGEYVLATDFDALAAENERLRAALDKFLNQSTFGSPYGKQALEGAIAHHNMWADVFRAALSPAAGAK